MPKIVPPFDMKSVPALSTFPPHDMGKRNWGQELLVAFMPPEIAKDGAVVKIIQMNAGHCGRFQKHWRRDEYGYILSGALLVRIGMPDGTVKEHTLGPGDCYHFPAGIPHQEEAITDMIVIELSPALGNDRVGLEAEYNLPAPPNDALPDATPDEIFDLKPWWEEGKVTRGTHRD